MRKIIALLVIISSLNLFGLQKQKAEAEKQQAAAMEAEWRKANEAEAAQPKINVEDALSGFVKNIKKKAKKACFKQGSLILSGEGESECLAIENVKIGDLVLSFDENSNEIVTKRVEEVFRVLADSLIEVRFENGQVIEATEDHPFYLGGTQLAAGDLREGDYVSTNQGELKVASTSVHYFDQPLIVYDISVESTHNYFVIGNGSCNGTDRGVLVHNCDAVKAVNDAYRSDPDKGIPEQAAYKGITEPIERACDLATDISEGNIGNLAVGAAGVVIGAKGLKGSKPSPLGIKYQPNPKHGKHKVGIANPAPKDPYNSLENSIELPGKTKRRIAVDKNNNEFAIFDEHTEGNFHGHSRSWDELDQQMKNVLLKEGLVSKKGKIK